MTTYYDSSDDCLPPFKAEVISSDETRPGCWNHLTVGVFKLDEGDAGTYTQIGSYKRNYHAMFNTFLPFVGQDGNWYALYSRNYVATRVMRLPSCEDIGGEDETNSGGLCPTDYYVPVLSGYETSPDDPKPGREGVQAPFGFVSGCVWGDDSSDKVEFLDLSEAHNGVLKRDQRFGYHELPAGIARLHNAVTVYNTDPDKIDPASCSITLAARKRFSYSGEEVNYDD